MDKDWIELVSRMETYDVDPFTINKSVVEFAKAILELNEQMEKPIEEEIDQDTLIKIAEAAEEMSRK